MMRGKWRRCILCRPSRQVQADASRGDDPGVRRDRRQWSERPICDGADVCADGTLINNPKLSHTAVEYGARAQREGGSPHLDRRALPGRAEGCGEQGLVGGIHPARLQQGLGAALDDPWQRAGPGLIPHGARWKCSLGPRSRRCCSVRRPRAKRSATCRWTDGVAPACRIEGIAQSAIVRAWRSSHEQWRGGRGRL